MIKTLFTNMGISHFEYSPKQKDLLESQRSLEERESTQSLLVKNQKLSKKKGTMTKYELFLLNLSKNLPKAFEWEALDDTIFNVNCSEPIEEINSSKKRLSFFPTYLGKDYIKCEWLQFQENRGKAENLAEVLGGQIKLPEDSNQPIVLYGPSFQAANSFFMEQDSLTLSLVKNLFYKTKKKSPDDEVIKKFRILEKLNFPNTRKNFLILILTALNS